MRHVTREQFLGILRIPATKFDAMHRADHVGLAFGTPMPETPGRYRDLDLVGMALVLAMGDTIGREAASTIVLACFAEWVGEVGRADADATTEFFFAVGMVRDAHGQPAKYVIAHGTQDELADRFRGLRGDGMAINLSDILRRLRANARELGIDLSQPFFFPPDDPRHAEAITEFELIREERLERFRQSKKKFRVHQARLRRHSIEAAKQC
jgi:hypothetical protein